ncbi:LysM peptidoglycan-binding domain-containing protein [Alteromonas sp. C1M14]|uniref:LysM peptidoglycan-binding domain-containing protein n=1 Tax=Alteromonas sp. C1M14 TaxID=2841567 RepID=UPI001C0A10A4|nr:LysM peptidoglycan-binding domain-containing protein [Alteromonas sp. C1M14]MBU2979719.1 LysM peptidoglycan-binding domain-containing protein [Alteromonas sp. C1M14]
MKTTLGLIAGMSMITLLSGCQLTESEVAANNAAPEINKPEPDTCEVGQTKIDDAQDCQVAKEGVIEVVHPVDDVDEALEDAVSVDEPENAEVNDVWTRLSNQFALTIPDDERVALQRDWYLKHPQYMARVVNRARPFLYYIADELEQGGIPLEIALLPIVESAFDPFAYSHGRAAGMWQFIPGTGKRFGMRQSWWYDGRRDIVASTQGAIAYLSYLNKMFDGDWLNALAAYNSGEGRVLRAIKRNKKAGKKTDFWSLDLPSETRAYVPKLLALADILKHRDTYNFKWPAIENVEVVSLVDIDSQIDLAFAADLADMDLEDLHALNPGFNRWATDPDGPHHLLLPVDKAKSFSQQLASIDQQDRLNWVRHTVKRGDSLLKLANQYHTTAGIIKKVNNLSSNMIRIGDAIMVPVALKELDSYSLSQDQRLASLQNKTRSNTKIAYKVKSGDTLWDIARFYKVSTRDLAKWNGMAPSDPLMPGKTLVVWQGKKKDATADTGVLRSLTYTVRSGDSLSRIAGKFNVKVSDITSWNNLSSKKYLQPGQKLTLHVDVTRLKNVG